MKKNKMNTNRIKIIVAIAVILTIAVASFPSITAKPIPGCVPDPLDPLADSDGDGISDCDEDLIGSDPCDPDSPHPSTPTPKQTPYQPKKGCVVSFTCLPFENPDGFRYIDTGEYVMCWASFPNPNKEVVSGWTTVDGEVYAYYSAYNGDAVRIEWKTFIPGDYKIESEFTFKDGTVCKGHTWVRVELQPLGAFIFTWAPAIVLAFALIVLGFTRRAIVLIIPGAIIIVILVLKYLGVI